MRAIVLAAGLGTRLRPLTDTLPKPLLPVGGRPLIHYPLLLLKAHGITDVFINVHYCGEQVMAVIGDGHHLGMNICYSHEARILGTGGGIKQIQAMARDEPLVVINGDVVADVNLTRLITFHRARKGIATLVLRENDDPTNNSLVAVDHTHRIRDIRGALIRASSPPPLRLRQRMFTGIHVIEPQVVNYISGQRGGTVPYSIIDAYIHMIERGERLFGYDMHGYFCDVGVPDRYHAVNRGITEKRIALTFLDGP